MKARVRARRYRALRDYYDRKLKEIEKELFWEGIDEAAEEVAKWPAWKVDKV